MTLQSLSKDRLDVPDLCHAFVYATDWLGVYVDEVNALNVYPVPDGDTGTNMHLTMQSVRRHLKETPPNTMPELAQALAKGSLLGARGNSGVILSQTLKGFADSIKESSTIDAKECILALKNAAKIAYEAVMKPVEGTMLTVIRRAAEGTEHMSDSHPIDVLKEAWEAGSVALEETPELLPVLKKAGVVDSGGLGFLRVLEGMIAAYEGRELPAPPEIQKGVQSQFEEEEFGFCTEFLLSGVDAPITELRDIVEDFGDSMLLVEAEGYVKGHIHTHEPEKLLGLMGRYGSMVRSKVEDMSLQHSELLEDVDLGSVSAPNVAVVAVSAGYGVSKVFRSLGARIVGGGQTNNPSVEDIADTVRGVAAQTVIVLPNNKNIVMAAQRVQDVITDKTVRVLPTRSLGEGLAAAVLFKQDADADELFADMQEAASQAKTLEVTFASKNADIDGLNVQEGEAIGLVNGDLKANAGSANECLLKLVSDFADDAEIGTLFYNSDISQEDAEQLVSQLEDEHDLELDLQPGSPDVYRFVLALE
jgi:DAK2 domain fusion protein YloV